MWKEERMVRAQTGYIFTILWVSYSMIQTAFAAEVIMESDTPARPIRVLKQNKQDKPVSIDALVTRYQIASEKEAQKIMEQIRQEIARISQERKQHAIGRVKQRPSGKPQEHTK